MPSTATYSVINPAVGTEYIAPSAYWVIPNASTQVKCVVQCFDSSGNLTTTTTLTGYTRDVTTSTNKSTVSGGPWNTADTIYSGPNGSDVYAAAGKVASSVYKLSMYLTYTGVAYDNPPNAPISLSPTGGAVSGLTPTFTGTFSDPDAGDTLYQYEIVVNTAANGGGSQQWDSGIINASTTEINNGAFSRAYGGSALTPGQTYSWKARTADQKGTWGSYSGWQNFQASQGPNAPSSVTPSGQQTTSTPAFAFTYTHPTPVNMQSYRYTITSAVGGALVYDSGTIAHNVASGTVTSGTIPGGSGMVNGQSYNFNIYATDTNGAVSPTTTVGFSIAPLPSVAPASPINNATVNTNTPTFAWSYTDANYTQASYHVVVQNASTSAVLWDSGVVASAASSVVSGASISYGTSIRWQVIVTDTAGLSSGWSAWAYAQVQNTPSATITNPTNLSTITNATPTVQWTYTPSSGSFPQASAQVILMDANGNTLQTYNVSGAGTTFPIPSGVLINDLTYKLKVSVTDTSSQTGTSSTITFTLQYTPPADMTGQPLAGGHNYLLGPHFLSDVNSDGIGDSWTADSNGPVGSYTYNYALSTDIAQPWQRPNGDGPFLGAQQIHLTSCNGAGAGQIRVAQVIDITVPGWTAGSTHVSLATWLMVQINAGSFTGYTQLDFYNGSNTYLSSAFGSGQGDTAGQIVQLLGPQNALIPATTRYIHVLLALATSTTADVGTVWFMGSQLEAAAASDANFIAGDLGTGFSFDANNFSVRSTLAGNPPTLIANPGASGDPVGAPGGTLTLAWDTSLADATRFQFYIIERRRQDQQNDDTAWVLLADITNKATSSFTDYTAGGNTVYQYSVRQLIVYPDGATGYSANRALVTGSVDLSGAWYLTNAQSTIYNLRLENVSTKRKFTWKERAQYSDFLGRVGTARDAGPDAGYDIQLDAYFDEVFGQDLPTMRRLMVTMQKLNVIWYLRSPNGMVVPVHLDGFDLDEEDYDSDTLMILTLDLMQAADSFDY